MVNLKPKTETYKDSMPLADDKIYLDFIERWMSEMSDVTTYKVARCDVCGERFTVIVWDVTDIDGDIFCPECQTPTDEYRLEIVTT